MNIKLSKPLILVGFMSSGKSTVGCALSKELKLPFIDTDSEIEKLEGKPVVDVFLSKEEAAFRKIESEVLQKNLKKYRNQKVVMATGGGILELPLNRELISKYAYSIFLSTSFEEIAKRISKNKTYHSRLFHKGFDRKLYEKRVPIYRRAHTTIVTDSKSIDQIVNEIVSSLNSLTNLEKAVKSSA